MSMRLADNVFLHHNISASPVDSSTIFLGSSEGSGVAEINCSPPYSGAHLYIWYHNSELIDNNTSSSLTVNYSQDSLDAFGVYQCFSVIHPHTMEEIKIIRILPFGELCSTIKQKY